MNDVKLSSLQSWASVNSTGSVSTNYIDLEQYGVTDEFMGPMWMNVVAGDDISVSALTEGLRITLRTSDNTNLSSSPVEIVSSGIILPARLVAGFRQSYGFCMAGCHRYLGAWVNAVNTSEGGGTMKFDIWLSDRPITPLKFQKSTTTS